MEQLVKILIPLGAVALIIGALVAPEKTLIAFIVFLFVLYGIWLAVDPEAAFMAEQRWLRRAELSELTLLWNQIGGIVIIIAGIVLLIVVLLKL